MAPLVALEDVHVFIWHWTHACCTPVPPRLCLDGCALNHKLPSAEALGGCKGWERR